MPAWYHSSMTQALQRTLALPLTLGLALALAPAPLLRVSAALAASPSFDCAKAESSADEAVCADAGLSALDRQLAEVFAAALSTAKSVADSATAVPELRATQRGWIKGRDDCWKASQGLAACLDQAYRDRIAELQAKWMLVAASKPVVFRCQDNSEVVATFMASNLPSARLERGDTTKIALQRPTASGSKYVADFGSEIWIKGQEARVVWDQAAPPLTCRASE